MVEGVKHCLRRIPAVYADPMNIDILRNEQWNIGKLVGTDELDSGRSALKIISGISFSGNCRGP